MLTYIQTLKELIAAGIPTARAVDLISSSFGVDPEILYMILSNEVKQGKL